MGDAYDRLKAYARQRDASRASRASGGFVSAPGSGIPAGPSPIPPPANVITTNTVTIKSVEDQLIQRWSGEMTGGPAIGYVLGCPPPWPPTGMILGGGRPMYNIPPGGWESWYTADWLVIQAHAGQYVLLRKDAICTSGGKSGYIVHNHLLKFDTSTIPDGATVTSATLRLNGVVQMNNNDVSIAFDWHPWSEEHGGSEDWVANVSGDAHVGTPLKDLPGWELSRFPYGSISRMTPAGWCEFPLTNVQANVSKTGFTYLRACLTGGPLELFDTAGGKGMSIGYNWVLFANSQPIFDAQQWEIRGNEVWYKTTPKENPLSPELVIGYG